MYSLTGLYLHVPFCRHLCNYCDFYKLKLEQASQQLPIFENLLVKEWEEHQRMMANAGLKWGGLTTLYFGGGTPSLWGLRGVQFCEKFLLQNLSLTQDCEWTLEVDPGTWTPEELKAWRDLGVNRLSIGVQAHDSEFLKIMDRVHYQREVEEILNYAATENWNFSVDLMLGLPYSKEKKRDVLGELDQLIKFQPKHFSLYILNTRHHYPHQAKLPQDDFIQEEYLKVCEKLTFHQFNQYEVSNFARSGFESRHNWRYWKSESLAALGPSASGFWKTPSGGKRYKWKVTTPLVEWEELNYEQVHLEEVYLALRTREGWKYPEKAGLLALLQVWKNNGLAHLDKGVVCLNSRGWVVMDSLMDDLFREKVL